MSDCVVDQDLHVSSFLAVSQGVTHLSHILLCKRARLVELSDKGHMRDLLSQDAGCSISYIILEGFFTCSTPTIMYDISKKSEYLVDFDYVKIERLGVLACT